MSTSIGQSENYQAWEAKTESSDEFWARSSDEDRFHHLAQMGHLAANSHNTQPWKFVYSSAENKLTVLIDTSRVLPISDIKGRQAVISLGCALANIETAAQALNCSLEKKVILSDQQKIDQQQADIAVVEYRIRGRESISNTTIDSMYRAIPSRRVDRGEYDHDRKIEVETLKSIEAMGSDLAVRTILISDWGRKVALAELQAQADAFVINNKQFAEELINDWMLENASKNELGMPGSTFRLNDEQTKKIKTRFQQQLGFESDDAAAMAQLGKKGILSCQCVGLLTVDADTPTQWLNAGITLEKGALLFEAQGIAWAVHAGLAEVSQVNMLMLRPIAMTSKRPVVLFRAGYLKSTESRSPHSPRLQFNKVWRRN